MPSLPRLSVLAVIGLCVGCSARVPPSAPLASPSPLPVETAVTRVGHAAEVPLPDFYRLFLVPGMGHCSGGAGPNDFGNGPGAPARVDAQHDMTIALDRWVEQGIAPDKLIGTGAGLTRPLCPYPQVARYKGTGDSNDAANFTCAASAQR